MPISFRSPLVRGAVAVGAACLVLGLFAGAVALFGGRGTGGASPPPVAIDDLLAEVDAPPADKAKDAAKDDKETDSKAELPPGDGAKAKAEVKAEVKPQPKKRSRPPARVRKPRTKAGSRAVRTARVGGVGPRIRFESVRAIQGLLGDGGIHLIVETGGAESAPPHRYLYNRQLGALPVPPSQFAAWREEGTLAELTPSAELSAALGIGSTSAYYVQVGARLGESIAAALEQARASRDRSVLVIRETGDVRVALARR